MKVDMSIVRNVNTDDHKRQLVDLLCSLPRPPVLKWSRREGDARGGDALSEAGVDLMQGYLYGEPQLTLSA